jgi:formate dehydrogenase subunit gamma
VRGRAFVAALLLTLAFPLLAQTAPIGSGPISVPNPGADLWREARHAGVGATQVQGVDTGVLITETGELWREYRVSYLVPYGGLVLGGMVGVFVLYFLTRGRLRIEGGRSGVPVERYTRTDRVVHWLVAIPFVLLGLTGLVLLFGRWVLIPLLGPEAFSALAIVSKNVHNFVGPFFVVMVPIMFFQYLRDSLFNLKVDLKWFRMAGGYLGGPHPSSEKVNAGQKLWFWTAVFMGIALSVSGLVLDFPNFGQGREWMQGAHLVHSVASVVVLAFFTVHLYLATIGVEGAFETMRTGKADARWVQQHHDLWYAELESRGLAPALPPHHPPST